MIPAKYSHLANGVRVVYDIDSDYCLRVMDFMIRDLGNIERCSQLAHNCADELRECKYNDPARVRVVLVYPAGVQ